MFPAKWQHYTIPGFLLWLMFLSEAGYNLMKIKGDIMGTKEIVTFMENGSTTYIDRDKATGEIPWNEHPKFKGVFLKHIIQGIDTDGMLSCHMVKIDPNAILEDHAHENQWELHEVIEGEGIFFLESKETLYHPGRMGIIPKGTNHKVIAGENGLILLAKFFPALI
jgi:quercetin dioxygenase-like cupin family protein